MLSGTRPRSVKCFSCGHGRSRGHFGPSSQTPRAPRSAATHAEGTRRGVGCLVLPSFRALRPWRPPPYPWMRGATATAAGRGLGARPLLRVADAGPVAVKTGFSLGAFAHPRAFKDLPENPRQPRPSMGTPRAQAVTLLGRPCCPACLPRPLDPANLQGWGLHPNAAGAREGRRGRAIWMGSGARGALTPAAQPLRARALVPLSVFRAETLKPQKTGGLLRVRP